MPLETMIGVILTHRGQLCPVNFVKIFRIELEKKVNLGYIGI